MTIIELCRLKKEDYDDDEHPDEIAVFLCFRFWHLAASGEAGFLSGL